MTICSGLSVTCMLFFGVLAGFHVASASISCQFTTGYCGWTPQYPADIWQLKENVTGSLGGTSSASQLYSGASGAASARSRYTNRRMSAKLLSEEMSLGSVATFSFWVRLSPSDSNIRPPAVDGSAGYLRAVLSNGTSVLLWSKTHDSHDTFASRIVVQLQPTENFRLEFELLVNNRYSSELMAFTLHGEGGMDLFLACTFSFSTCNWSSDGGTWEIVKNENGSFTPPAISADTSYLMAENPKSSNTAHTAILRSPMLHITIPLEFSFFYRCKHPKEYGPYAELAISTTGYPEKNVAIPRENTWEHAFTVLYPVDNIQVEIIATLPPDSLCAIDQLAWSVVENEHYRPLTTQAPTTGTIAMQTTTSSVAEAVTTVCPTTISQCTEPSQSIVIRCSRGNLTISDTNFDLSDALTAEMFSDYTLKCRHILRDMHKWLLRQPYKVSGSESADVIHAKGNSQTGLTISDTEPELTEAVRLVYSTGINTACRTVFLGYLKAVMKYA